LIVPSTKRNDINQLVHFSGDPDVRLSRLMKSSNMICSVFSTSYSPNLFTLISLETNEKEGGYSCTQKEEGDIKTVNLLVAISQVDTAQRLV
jgi:hypothetical protein